METSSSHSINAAWSGLLPILLGAEKSGSPCAAEELKRMAALADGMVAVQGPARAAVSALNRIPRTTVRLNHYRDSYEIVAALEKSLAAPACTDSVAPTDFEDILSILRAAFKVLHSADCDHDEFLDSGADSLDLLRDLVSEKKIEHLLSKYDPTYVPAPPSPSPALNDELS